jgi:hypothetical protein
MSNTPRLAHTPHAASAFAGVARRDITPPLGIYARMWGAAKHDISEGTHMPLSVTALAVKQNQNADPIFIISIDLALLGDLGGVADEEHVMGDVMRALGRPRGAFLVNCTHTHSSPWAATSRSNMPGGEMIGPYLARLADAMTQACREALATAEPSTFTYATGRCSLATNRDLPDPEQSKNRVICGFNPAITADDTVMVARITRDQNQSVLATIVNYACHPTTFAWLNKLISPDYIGSMRTIVEAHTNHAPCLFLQGASGETAPAHQYTGDPAVPEKHGRQLGYAVLSTLEGMLAPRQELVYQGVTESGAPLAVWYPEPCTPPNVVASSVFMTPLQLKPLPTPAEVEADIAKTQDRTMRERLYRKLQIVKTLKGGKSYDAQTWVFRIGQALFIAHPNEAYSCFQIELREAFPDFSVFVMNTSGAELGYLCPPAVHEQNVYQAWQTPFDKPALKTLTDLCIKHGRELTSI